MIPYFFTEMVIPYNFTEFIINKNSNGGVISGKIAPTSSSQCLFGLPSSYRKHFALAFLDS